ncbi:MAG TPA: AI-2E family transporter [Candidatus Nanoarchaeia archaeon]|nr:AI-2E family transporter [Candidatus Nanoarchaeia archaeon]
MEQRIKQYIFWAMILGMVILSWFIVKQTAIALVSAFILSYLASPLYRKLQAKMPNSLAAAFCISLILIIIILPLLLIAGSIISQAASILNDSSISERLNEISSEPFLRKLNIDIELLKTYLITHIMALLGGLLGSFPSLALNILVLLVGVYYMLIAGDRLGSTLIRYIPFKHKEKIAKEIGSTTRAIIYGMVLVALLEGVIAFIGFSLAGVKAALLLAALIFLFAFIPGLGPVIVWAPTAFFYGTIGHFGTSIGVILTGLVISLGIEIMFVGKIVGKRARIHPLIMLVGILGGVPIFGIFGFVIGPLMLAYTIKLIENSLD